MSDPYDSDEFAWLEPLRERTREIEEETRLIREKTKKSGDVQMPNGDFLKNYPDVTRVEVIGNNGREYVQYECSDVQVSLQDDGRTVKVFLKQEQISEEENERRFKECMEMINNLKPGDIEEMMGSAFIEEFRRVSQ
jgi:hypothetical protein